MKILVFIFLSLGINLSAFSQPTWNSQNSGTVNNLRDITSQATFQSEIFVCGENGTIMKTSNRGANWHALNSTSLENINSIQILYNDSGFAAGSNGLILRTTNGGVIWTHDSSGTHTNINKIIPYSLSYAFAVGDNGTFLRLQGGKWVSTQIDTVNLNSIVSFVSSLWIVGDAGTILKSTDQGQNWSRISSGTNQNLNFISTNGISGNIILGNSGVAFEIIGNVVTPINSGTTYNLYSMSIDGSEIACGANGTILRNWQKINSKVTADLNSILTRSEYCWIVGSNGTILFSNDFQSSDRSKQLNANNINTWFNNDGGFNMNPVTSNPGFEWPKGENKFARYSSGTVIGAIVNGDTLVTVCQYGSEYLPGYTDNAGKPHGSSDPDYRIYKLVYNVNDEERSAWPNSVLGNSDQGAPVYFDSIVMSWKPVDYGNQTMFYSYTDSYPEAHTQYSGETAPLKADIKQINFSFNQPDELKNIIYQEYRIINRNSSPWTNAYINLYTDDDLGNGSDDKAGVDSVLGLAYTFNATNFDETYGTPPPAVGFLVIRSPVVYTGVTTDSVFYYEGKQKRIKSGYKETGLGSTVIFRDDGLQPGDYAENYNAIRGLQNNGSQYINPIFGYTTKFVYSGNPYQGTGWLYPGSSDARFYMGFGPLNMNPGDTQIVVIAQLIAKGTSNLRSVYELERLSEKAKDFYNDCFSNVVIGINNNSTGLMPDKFMLKQNYPNPFNPKTIINYELQITNYVTLKVFDALGKEVSSLVNQKQTAGSYSVEFNGESLASGIYFYSLSSGNFSETKKMLLLK